MTLISYSVVEFVSTLFVYIRFQPRFTKKMVNWCNISQFSFLWCLCAVFQLLDLGDSTNKSSYKSMCSISWAKYCPSVTAFNKQAIREILCDCIPFFILACTVSLTKLRGNLSKGNRIFTRFQPCSKIENRVYKCWAGMFRHGCEVRR